MSEDATLRIRDEDVTWRLVEGEIVALDIRTSTFFALNRTGALLWQELARGASRDDLLRVLTESCGVDGDDAARDVDAFLAEMEAQRLLRP